MVLGYKNRRGKTYGDQVILWAQPDRSWSQITRSKFIAPNLWLCWHSAHAIISFLFVCIGGRSRCEVLDSQDTLRAFLCTHKATSVSEAAPESGTDPGTRKQLAEHIIPPASASVAERPININSWWGGGISATPADFWNLRLDRFGFESSLLADHAHQTLDTTST